MTGSAVLTHPCIVAVGTLHYTDPFVYLYILRFPTETTENVDVAGAICSRHPLNCVICPLCYLFKDFQAVSPDQLPEHHQRKQTKEKHAFMKI